MLGPADRLVLAAGVRLVDGRLTDGVRASSWPLNATGCFVLERAGHRLGEIAAEVAAAFALPVDQARSDVLAFAWQLNRLTLVNIEHGQGRLGRALTWLTLALRLLPAGTLPPATAERRPLDTRTAARAAGSVVRAVWTRMLTVAVLTVIVVLQLGAVAGGLAFVPALVGGIAAGTGVALHEGAHAATLRGVPSALIVQGRRTYVLHAPTGKVRRALVALAGPASACSAGVALMAAATAAASPALALAGGVFCAHAAGLSLLGAGRKVGVRTLRALVVGMLAAGVLAYAGAAALAVAVQAGTSGGLHIAIGGLVLVAVERSDDATATTFGAGLLVLAVAGGILNALAAALLSRRS